jgi:predicted CXXCH cytochrome family protein
VKASKAVLLTLALVATLGILAGALLIHRGFRANREPSQMEKAVARRVRDFTIPGDERSRKNPLDATQETLQEGRDEFQARCATCHGFDGSGRTSVGRNLYPRAPDLQSPETQGLTDGEIHYIIENGVALTGMPAWSNSAPAAEDESWKLVLFIRSLRKATPREIIQQAQLTTTGHYVGSQTCAKCHAEIYEHWRKTPMANIVRDPREHPEAILPDLATNNISRFSRDDVAFVYGSIWKQRYFTKIGDDYFPLPVQWEVKNHKWSKYTPPKGSDWWTEFYPEDEMQRPTGPTCDGCHSVAYDVHAKRPAEWNVGCEACHGPGSEHAAHPAAMNTLNPARMDYVAASDTCIQCHSQGRPLNNPIEGKYFDWAAGYHVGLRLQDYWRLEEHGAGESNFYYFADGTAHKNRMQGNDFVQSVMYARGVTCFDCHDAHGTGNYAQLRKPAQELCQQCHAPMSANGPRTATLEEHTHHKAGSAGSECVACHMPAIETEGPPNTFVHAHTFRFVTPAMTERSKISNPCTMCHGDKTTAWATEQLRGWKERSPWRVGS